MFSFRSANMKLILVFIAILLIVQNDTRPQNKNVQQLFQDPQFVGFLEEWYQQRRDQNLGKNQTGEEPKTPQQKPKQRINYANNPFLTNQIKTTNRPKPVLNINNNPFLGNPTSVKTTTSIPFDFQNFFPQQQQQHQTNRVVANRKQQNNNLIKNDKIDEIFREQAENAHYDFTSHIHDGINDGNHQRQETRDGLTVRGQYSYSDGYVNVTVKYEADDKGFRIIGEDREFIGNGPEYHPDGRAQIATFIEGQPIAYEITSDDIVKNRQNVTSLFI